MIRNTYIMKFSSDSFIRLIFLFLLLSPSAFPLTGGRHDQLKTRFSNADIFDPVEPVIVWNSSAAGEDSIDQLSFQNAFSSIGLLPARKSLLELSKIKFNSNTLIILQIGRAHV